jgi:hypothetical protein
MALEKKIAGSIIEARKNVDMGNNFGRTKR